MKSKKKRKRENKRRIRGRRRKRRAKGMDSYGFLWIILDTCIDFYGFVWKKNQIINPFLMNLDIKEPYLVYWLCFGLGLVDCNPQLRNIYIKKILGF